MTEAQPDTAETLSVRAIEDVSVESKSPSPAEARLRLLKSGLSAFTRYGYRAATSRMITDPVGMTPAMLNYYFGSKEGFFQKLVELSFTDIDREVADHLREAESKGFTERVRAIIRAHLRLGIEAPTAVEFLLSLTYGPSEANPAVDLAANYQRTAERMSAVFTDAIARGEFEPVVLKDPFELADHLLSLLSHVLSREIRRRRALRGATTLVRSPALKDELESVESRIAQLFFKGVGQGLGIEK